MIGRTVITCSTMLLLATVVGCSDYRGLSPQAYQYAKALYNATNRERIEKVAVVNDLIATSEQNGTITGEEAKWLREIIEDSRKGNWKMAQQTARQMMRDQVR